MRDSIYLFGFPLICLAVAAVCAGIVYRSLLGENGGKLTQEDARYAAGCLIVSVRNIFVVAYMLSIFGIAEKQMPRLFPEYPVQAGGLFLLLTIVILPIIATQFLVRWKVYRKLRYIAHWHFSRDSDYYTRAPKWARRSDDGRKK